MLMENHLNISINHVFFTKVMLFCKKKTRQGCTTQKTELGMHQPPISNRNPSKHQIIGFLKVGGRDGSL